MVSFVNSRSQKHKLWTFLLPQSYMLLSIGVPFNEFMVGMMMLLPC